jgi:hypothetical protein
MYVRIRTYICICMYVCICMHMYVYMYIHICMYLGGGRLTIGAVRGGWRQLHTAGRGAVRTDHGHPRACGCGGLTWPGPGGDGLDGAPGAPVSRWRNGCYGRALLSVLKSHFARACIGLYKQLYRLCERRFVRTFDLQKGFSLSEAVNDGSGKGMVWVPKI